MRFHEYEQAKRPIHALKMGNVFVQEQVVTSWPGSAKWSSGSETRDRAPPWKMAGEVGLQNEIERRNGGMLSSKVAIQESLGNVTNLHV